MGVPPLLIQLQSEERKELERLANRPSTPQQLAQRMRIVILAADGLNNEQISQQLGVSTKMVRYWRRRWKESEGEQPPPLLDRLSDQGRLKVCPARPWRRRCGLVCSQGQPVRPVRDVPDRCLSRR